MVWRDYDFLGSDFPHTYIIHPQGKPLDEKHRVEINTLYQYLKMVRGMHPAKRFKSIKVHRLGWEIKYEWK